MNYDSEFNLKNDLENKFIDKKVTISVRQRNARQHITIISGLADDLDTKKILKYLKNKLKCSGTIINDDKFGEIITLTGNQKDYVYEFLVEQEIYTKDNIILQG